jgi:predicted ATP-grasp superfamily ATP-dependent carboligase
VNSSLIAATKVNPAARTPERVAPRNLSATPALPQPPGHVLLTDGQERSAAAAARSLAASGYEVGAAAYRPLAPGSWSSSCGGRYRVTDPRRGLRRFTQEISRIASRDQFSAVLPGSDVGLLAISRHRELLPPGVRHGLPAKEVVEDCLRKTVLAREAQLAGLDSPTTIACLDIAQAHRAAESVGFPLLLKPRRTIFHTETGIMQRPATLIRDHDELTARVPDYGTPCLMQRRERGVVVSFAGVITEGALEAWVFSRYRRTWPAQAGPVSFSVTAEPPPKLIGTVRRLLCGLGWQGPFELELIERAPGEFCAIDFNPRLYGSLALGARAGVSLAAIWCDRLLERPTPRQRFARPGWAYRWEDAELRHVALALRQRAPLRAASILIPRPRTAHPYFSWRDPAPLLARGSEIVRNLVRKARGAIGSGTLSGA